MVSDENQKFYLGRPFLTRYYTILDIENYEVGFVLAADSSKIPDNSDSTTIVLSVVFGLLFVALVVGGGFCWKKKKAQAQGNTEGAVTFQEVRQE